MATIRKLPSGKWNVQIRQRGKIVASATRLHREAAVAWGSQKEQELASEHPLFQDAGYAYCHEVLERKPSQMLAFNRIDRVCKVASMHKRMDAITLQDVNAFKRERLDQVSQTTCRDELMMIRRVFTWYIEEQFARSGTKMENPCDLLRIPRPSKPRDRVVTRRELNLLLSAMSPHMALIVELAYETAMRRGEILKLRPMDLSLDRQFLRVVAGKEGSRDVPLTRRAVALLERALASSRASNLPLFDVASYSVTQAVRRAREVVGLDDNVRFHQLRHSRITEVARKGLNLSQIMMVSGHRDIRSVQRYTHLNVQDVIGLID
ncbi:MAG: site-specific integrase [Pseudomonadota bacterium]